jgi:CheY-like chemotaxis protein
VRDGEQCVAYLSGTGKFANRDEFPLPDLLLLDLKMPGMDGFDVLLWLRQQPTLSALRVIVITSSESLRDVNRAYQLGANSFLVKPGDFENYIEMSKFLLGFLQLCKAPEIRRPAKPGAGFPKINSPPGT